MVTKMDEKETWVQCVKCQKWRVVPDTVKLADNWQCRYNVFSSEYNRCSAAQEPMPAAEAAAATPPPIVDEVFANYSVVEDGGKDSLFTKSTCSCTLCREINNAVDQWDNKKMAAHAIPLVACLLKSISNTAHIADAIEEDKTFLYK